MHNGDDGTGERANNFIYSHWAARSWNSLLTTRKHAGRASNWAVAFTTFSVLVVSATAASSIYSLPKPSLGRARVVSGAFTNV